MKKKTCLITGATGGIGESLCNSLANDYNLIIVSRNLKKLKSLKKKINQKNYNNIEYFKCDFSDINNIQLFLKKITNKKIDVLINNAAIFDINNYDSETTKRTIDSININLVSHMLITKHVIKQMKKNCSGKIIFIGSTSAYKGNKNTVSYCVAKHGILGLSRSLNDEFNKFNIQSFIISPGIVKTKMSKKIPNQNTDTYINSDDIAYYINFILNEKSSSFLNEILVRRMRA